jgi:hypothetical protein
MLFGAEIRKEEIKQNVFSKSRISEAYAEAMDRIDFPDA